MSEKSIITRTKLPQGWRWCVWKNGIRRGCYEDKPLAEAYGRELDDTRLNTPMMDLYEFAREQLGELHPVTALALEAIVEEYEHFLTMYEYGRDENDYFLDGETCYKKLYNANKLPI